MRSTRPYGAASCYAGSPGRSGSLLAIGFIPPGLWKVLGIPFTKIPDSNPVGLFFHGLEQATVPFPGTWVITSLMLLGVVYLLCWDWNRVKYVVYPQQ